MIIRLRCVMMDGTEPGAGDPLVPYAQDLVGDKPSLPAVPAGVDVSFQIDFVGQNGQAFDMSGYQGRITCRHSSSSADPVFSNAITFSTSTGTSFATSADTADETPRTCVYDVQVVSADDKVDQPIPESKLLILSSISDEDEPVVAAGPEMLLVGVPAPAAEDLGKVVVPTDDDPLALAWTASPFEVATGAAAIDAGAAIKASSTASQYETLGAADDPTMMVGVAKTACSGAAASFQAFFARPVRSMLSDGTDTIAAGAPVEPSTSVAGRIKEAADSTTAIGFNVGAAVAAVLDEAVSVR